MNPSNLTLSRFLGPMPGRREAHALARLALAAGVILCGISIALGFAGRSFLGRPLGGDFVEFYTAGRILNQHAGARLYDLAWTAALDHEAVPAMSPTQMLVFAQGPFVAALYRPFALLPYSWAYGAWLVFSAVLFAAALWLLFGMLGFDNEDRKTGFLMAFSFAPFLFETWIGGQIAPVIFFVWVLFFWCLENRWEFPAGFVLALGLFRPTLIAIPVLMLLLGRRWRVMGGFAAGAMAAAALSIMTVGMAGCRAWLQTLSAYAKWSQGGEAWHRGKNIDVLACVHLLLPDAPNAAIAIAAALGLAGVAWLGWAWWRSPRGGDRILWAATLCLMLVVNPYVPIYDSILLVCAAALAASVRALPSGWLLALYLIPWVTQSFAEFLHLQLFTYAIVGFGFWLLEGCRNLRFCRFRQRREESTMTDPLALPSTGRFQVRSRGLL